MKTKYILHGGYATRKNINNDKFLGDFEIKKKRFECFIDFICGFSIVDAMVKVFP